MCSVHLYFSFSMWEDKIIKFSSVTSKNIGSHPELKLNRNKGKVGAGAEI